MKIVPMNERKHAKTGSVREAIEEEVLRESEKVEKYEDVISKIANIEDRFTDE